MQIPLILPSLQQHKLNVNLYYDPHARYGRPALCATPGLTSLVDIGSGTLRGIHYNAVKTVWVVVMGTTVYTVSTGWSATSKGTFSGTGKVWIASNDNGDTIISSTTGIASLNSSLTLDSDISDVAPYAGPVCYQDKMILVADYGGDQFTPSDISAITWEDYDPSYSSGQADTILDMISLGRTVFVIGEETVEAFYNSGDATAPFARIQGSLQHIASKGYRAQTVMRGSIYMLTRECRLVRITGTGGYEVVSTPQVEYLLQQLSNSEMWVFALDQRGWVCVSGDYGGSSATYVYSIDAAQTGLNPWFQWASGTTSLVKMPIFCSAFPPAYTDVLGEIDSGHLFGVSNAVYSNNGSAFRTVWYIPPMREDRRQVFHHCLEVEHKEGTSTAGSQTVSLEYTDNREASAYQTTTAITLTGSDYDQLLRWWQLGVARERMYKVYCDAAIERAYFGANLIASVGSVAGTEE